MNKDLISVKQAKELIREHTIPLLPVSVPLIDAAGKILAEDLFSNFDIPAFAQSSMDGYAFRYNDWIKHSILSISGEMAAGATHPTALPAGTAMRIFTGAPLPEGADTVVMQEKTSVENGILSILDDKFTQGANVRLPGTEIQKAALAVKANTLLSAGAIGFLAGLGISQVKIFPEPTISIIITGNELQKPGTAPIYGKVFESNSFALMAALKSLHAGSVQVHEAGDDLEELINCLQKALMHSNLVLLTGGVSVGDYDFVVKAAERCGVEAIFHGILQRPGKPLYAGKHADKWVFGLPGNPSSVLTCFYEYVLEAISIMTMHTRSLEIKQATISHDFHKANRLTQFLKGYYDGSSVEILEAQESYKMRSFARANCLVVMEPEMEACRKGQMIEIHLLPL